ncbi:MAG TPA: SIMPL domain-containing protein [Terriglobales bacterium]
MKKYLASLFLLLAACTLLAAQDQSNVPLQQNAVIVGADGEFESAPDTAIINFVIAAQESDSQTAFVRAGRAADRVREVLRSNGIDPKTAELSQYNLQPVYDYKSPKRKIVGYTVSSNVTIKLKDFKKIPPLLQGFSTIEETENQSFSYSLEQIEEAKSKAVQNAYQRARIYAQSLAQASGRSLGEMTSANIDIREIGRPIPMMASNVGALGRAAQAPGPTEGFGEQKIKITAHVIASFVLK